MRTSMTQSQMTIAKEIRRQTMFSCLILDRLLGCGKGWVSTIRSEDLHIQLPCSEISFDLSKEAYTGFLIPRPEDRIRGAINDSVLGWFVRLVDLWGRFPSGVLREAVSPRRMHRGGPNRPSIRACSNCQQGTFTGTRATRPAPTYQCK